LSIKLAIPTRGYKGMNDLISDIFARAETFTYVDIQNYEIKKVEVIENPSRDFKLGAGPITVKMLADKGVNMVFVTDLGPGVSQLLEEFNIEKVVIEHGTRVTDSVKKVLKPRPSR
jgi:predicted Fe-Mo cluster-binding NifX family protein